jgi:hypothetical protein
VIIDFCVKKQTNRDVVHGCLHRHRHVVALWGHSGNRVNQTTPGTEYLPITNPYTVTLPRISSDTLAFGRDEPFSTVGITTREQAQPNISLKN